MNVQSETGHVTPRRQHRRGVGMLFFLAAALAPLFIPPALALAGLIAWVRPDLLIAPAGGPGLSQAADVMRDVLLQFPVDLVQAIGSLDLANAPHLLVFLVILLGAPGSRPSHIKSRFHDGGAEGDIAVLRKRIREHPWPLLAFLAIMYVSYLLVLWLPGLYWWPFLLVWAVGITGVVLALFGALWWSIAAENVRLHRLVAWLPPAGFVAAQLVLRGTEWPVPAINAAAVAAWSGLTAVGLLVARRQTVYDRF